VPQILLRLAPGVDFAAARRTIAARSPALLAAVSAVLLIAATNLTNLLLARASQRSSEFAVRMALGAPASRIRRQMLIEVLLIATAGAAGGALLAWGLPSALVKLFSGANNTIHIETNPDWTMALFAAAVFVATTLLAGWAPAALSSRTQPNRMLLATARVSKSLRGRAVLIAMQTGLTLILLVGTALLAGSLRELWRENTGMASTKTTFFFPDLYNAGIDRPQMSRAYDNILRGARALPGISSAAWTMNIPLTGSMGAFQVTIPGRPTTPGMSNLTFWH
jgi:putative ABC transport system permease protein